MLPVLHCAINITMHQAEETPMCTQMPQDKGAVVYAQAVCLPGMIALCGK